MKISRLVIGTNNPAKLADWKSMLTGTVEIVGLSDLSTKIDVAETGSTFAENAALKASEYAKAMGEYVYSEDGGFEIDALDGWPGVTSRRMLPDGSEATDEQMISYTLEKMKDVPDAKRQAHLVVHSAVSDPSGKIIFTASGSLDGQVPIVPGPVFTRGYPFRAILYLPQMGKTYAELSEQEHQQYNHKKPLAEKLISFLSTFEY